MNLNPVEELVLRVPPTITIFHDSLDLRHRFKASVLLQQLDEGAPSIISIISIILKKELWQFKYRERRTSTLSEAQLMPSTLVLV